MSNGIQCKVCERGTLQSTRVHRMSNPVVAIGYILLIPSVLGIVLSLTFIVMSCGAAGVAASGAGVNDRHLSPVTIQRLESQKIPTDMVKDIEEGHFIAPSAMSALTDQQKLAVQSAQSEVISRDAARAGATGAAGCLGGCGSLLGIIGAMFSFIGGLLGWILVMKKTVLKCGSCGAVVAAS